LPNFPVAQSSVAIFSVALFSVALFTVADITFYPSPMSTFDHRSHNTPFSPVCERLLSMIAI